MKTAFIFFCAFQTFAAFAGLAMWDTLANDQYGKFVLIGSIAWVVLLAVIVFVVIVRALRTKQAISGN